jgi:hypothetical protein
MVTGYHNTRNAFFYYKEKLSVLMSNCQNVYETIKNTVKRRKDWSGLDISRIDKPMNLSHISEVPDFFFIEMGRRG